MRNVLTSGVPAQPPACHPGERPCVGCRFPTGWSAADGKTPLCLPCATGHTFRFAVASCVACRGSLFLIGDEPRECPVCRRANVVAEASRLVGDVRALRDALPPFDVLTPGERAEQLAALATDEALIAVVADRHASDEMLEAAAVELARRLHLGDPTPAERAEAEADGDEPARRSAAATRSIDFSDLLGSRVPDGDECPTCETPLAWHRGNEPCLRVTVS